VLNGTLSFIASQIERQRAYRDVHGRLMASCNVLFVITSPISIETKKMMHYCLRRPRPFSALHSSSSEYILPSYRSILCSTQQLEAVLYYYKPARRKVFSPTLATFSVRSELIAEK
jgi:hypothetical protein